ncbi:MAG: 4-hydroxybutyrate CoA transferase [Chloroflexi bacterium]|nr:4-hydroxybutyrate CoA transferase [Chloroflexota bacterium]MCY3589019.1 4-hydroxybutyrate CoA transferase [Chloroflexota bacterium]MCY3684779.1 4-hydroxybutyrate CoA transferase [Chloroflexota bacterium]MDE2709784.1 4-hydroxybutyrate CoA transferase [Chloroflexota bacterium]
MTTSPYIQRRTSRFDPTINWRDVYAERLATPEMAAALFNSGDHLWIPPGHASLPILQALVARSDELEGVEVRGIVVPDAGWFTEEMMGAFKVAPQFGTLFDRDAVNAGIADYHPYWLVGIHKAWDAGREDEAWPIDVLQIRCTPPNDAGFVSLGSSVWDGVTSAKRAQTVIAEVNDNVVETFGDSWLHVSEIDCFVPADTPVMVNLEFPEPNQVDLGLTHYVSQLVQDGDTIQVGVGSHSGALARLGAFDERENLSYFAELTTEGLVPLVERGIITGKYSKTHPDKFVATVIGNTPDEIATVHRNPAFETYSIEYLLDPRQIARNENIVAINGALTADLSGQLGVHTIGPRVYAGVGGHLAFALGAYLAPKGRSVTVLPSTSRDGTISTIMAQFDPGQIVTVPRDIADTVVTEYGIARLLGKTVRARAEELISVAHPDFRGELRKAAQKLFYP